MKSSWGIVGLGWLGQTLAEKLKILGHDIWGTHRDEFDFYKDPFPQKKCDILFLNTPPLIQMSAKDYVNKIFLSDEAKIILISSISVYGNPSAEISESSTPFPITESGQWLLRVETALRERFNERLLVIRPGGLIGGKRHPVFSLINKSDVAKGNHAINLIHRDDLCEIIRIASESDIPLLNAVTPFHPRKDVYYNEWAIRMNLPKFRFSVSSEAGRKILSNQLPVIYPHWICPRLDFL